MRACAQCASRVDSSRADASYCSSRCRSIAWRARRSDAVHALLTRQAEITRSRISALLADDAQAVAAADRLLDEIDLRAAELFGARS